MDEVFEQNLLLLSNIAVGDETNPVIIEKVFSEIYHNIAIMNPVDIHEFLTWIRRYFFLLGKSMIDSFYHTKEFSMYRRDILQCLKNSLQHKKYLNELKKMFLKCQAEKAYSQLPHLFCVFYQIVCAMDIREYYLIETGNILYYDMKYITYIPKEEIVDPFDFDNGIKESMLELKSF